MDKTEIEDIKELPVSSTTFKSRSTEKARNQLFLTSLFVIIYATYRPTLTGVFDGFAINFQQNSQYVFILFILAIIWMIIRYLSLIYSAFEADQMKNITKRFFPFHINDSYPLKINPRDTKNIAAPNNYKEPTLGDLGRVLGLRNIALNSLSIMDKTAPIILAIIAITILAYMNTDFILLTEK